MVADTSAAAWASIAPAASRLRAIVFRTLHANPGGLTVDETCRLVSMPRYSLQPRFTELRDAGSIIDTGKRRPNVSGAKARVWAIADRGEVAA